jgi:hypothetical protein
MEMKIGTLIVGALVALAPCLVGSAAAAEPSLAGSWLTDVVVIAKQMQAELKEALASGDIEDFDEDGAVARAYRNRVANNPRSVSNASSSSGGASSGGARSRNGGNTGTVGGGGNTGGFSGGGARSSGGGGGGGRRGGNNFLPASQEEKRGVTASPKKSEEPEDSELSGPAITLELKASKDKLTGNVIEILPDDLSDEKLKVEEGTISGKTFKFVTYIKRNGAQFPIRWEGQLVSEKTLKVTRKNASGKVVDAVGEITLTRAK